MDSATSESIQHDRGSLQVNARVNSAEVVSEMSRILDQGLKPFEIILKGGAPWGFALNGGSNSGAPLHISKIVAGGKASESDLVEGDFILLVNGKPCSDVGHTLDIVDTASSTLAITVVRGHLDNPVPGIQPQLSRERTPDVKDKHVNIKRTSDDSVVYSKSKSSQMQAGSVRHHHKRRGDSFNVGKLKSVQSESRVAAVRSYHPISELQTSSGTDNLLRVDKDSGRGYNDNCRLPSPVHHQDNPANMNRRRSDGPSIHQQNQQLLATKSSPNLAKTGDDQVQSDSRISRTASRDQIQLVKSSPSLLDDAIYKQINMDLKYQPDVSRSSDFIMRQGGYGDFGDRTYTVSLYTSDGNSPRQNVRRSLPAHGLHRYQPDYENVSHLGTAPLRSEKISEIEDIDEVTSRDSNPQSPDVKDYDPFRGAGLPTRDPASLKYIKVNQNHEKYPSWPVTKPNGATEQTQPINSRAQSMTDHTSTSKEFPKKQQLAYTPGLRPLAEKNSPTSDRKADDGKARNGSDPGFKSEFVYGRYGRVQRRDVGNSEGRFDDFYNNSKAGYPPPNMDPDGRNLGDKEYNAPSPPERDSKGVDYTELSHKLGNIGSCGKTDIGHTPQGGTKRVQELHTPLTQMNTSAVPRTRPSELSLNMSKGSLKQNFDSTDTGTSPFDKSSSLFNLSHKGMRANSHVDGVSIQQNKYPSLYDSKYSSSKQDVNSHSLLASPNTQSQMSHTPSMNWRSSSQKDHALPVAVQRDRPSSSYDRSPSHSGKSDIPNFPSSGDKSKAYIVKSTPYYNTSTQTDMLPYAIKMSDPSGAAIKSKHAEIQVGGYSPEASPSMQEEQKKLFEEKSIQARMSRDFEHNDLNTSNKRQSFGMKEQNEDFFRYPSSMMSAGQTSPFKGFQSIHAKYATDEQYGQSVSTNNYKAIIPTFSDNASMLRKLSEEFYGSKLGLMQDKRMSSSSSQESPRFDPAHPIAVHQPGMREAESYSSIVIHQDEKIGLFGGDDVSSVSSFADSRHDVSSVHLDSTSDFKSIDLLATRGRSNISTSYPSQKTRLHQQDPKMSASKVHNKELSGPASSFNITPAIGLSRVGGKVTDQPMLGGTGSDAPLTSSNSRSISSDTRSSQSTSTSSSTDSPFAQIAPASFNSSAKQAQGKQATDVGADKSRADHIESDSVFVADDDDDREADDYEFSRKPSMRKAYGIYDETERLISQSKALTQATKSGSERQASQSIGVSIPGSAVPASRGNRYSESLGLGRIQEESDAINAGHDLNSSSLQKPVSGKMKANEQVFAGKPEKLEKYPWQNEAWLRSQISVPGESNLRRTASEQIAIPKQNMSMKVSSYDTDCGLQRSGQVNATSSASAFHNYDKKINPLSPSLDAHNTHSRTKSEDLPRHKTEQDQTHFAQQDQRRYHDHNTNQPQTANRGVKDTFTADFSPYESIAVNRSSSESVADVICKVNEDLAKSAERVDSIRRSNSSSSRNSSEYVDMSRDRNRRETDWSRLRTSGSLRYSPDQERRSSRSSFASENLYEDISAFTSSTPRSSFAESTDKILQPGNSNASMDSGLVASPTYQNFPYQRRAPPLPPRSPSPDETPPALPPRKYREQQPPNDDGDTATPTSHNPSMSPGFSNEKNGINVLPVGNQPNEENQVDRTKRDFKSLMTQWENNTPREDKYAAELRKQAQKFNSNQHQHVNAMPASYERTRTKINFATTYKHEPMQPQEATSPQSSSLPPLSQTPSISTMVSSSFSGASLSSSSPSSVQPSSNFHQPSSKSNNSSRATRQEGGPATSNNSPSSNENTSLRSMPYPSSVNTSQGSMTTSSYILGNPTQSKTPERSKLADDFRNRSGSDVLHSKPPISGSSDVTSRAQSTVHHQLRERSSSEHDILSDRRQKHPSQQPVPQTSAHPREGAPMGTSKWRSGRAAGDAPAQTKVEIVSMRDGKFTPPPAQMITGLGEAKASDRSDDSEGFADESYIGHKNKSSRAIGTYKRSKSAVVLESSGSSYKDADPESLPFQDPKLGQQSWSSESVLSRTETDVDQEIGTGRAGGSGGDRVGTPQEYLNAASPSTPVRPARPSAQGRHSLGQLQTSSLISSSSTYQNNHSSVPSSLVPGSGPPGKHFVTDQPSHETRRDSHQRFPPASLPDSSYDPNPSTSRSKPQPSVRSSNSPQRRPDDGVERGHFNNIGQSHYSAPKRNYPNDVASGINSWSPHNNNNYSTTSSPTSSQAGPFYSKPGDNGSWSPYDSPPDSASQREYQRRESAPVRLTTPTNNPESKLDVPHGEATGTSRRRSDSNMNSAQRPDNSNYDASTSSHSRQPSQEELECDEKAKELAQELTGKEHKLSEVLRLDANKKRMQYMDGLFSESVEVSSLGDRSSFSQETRSSVTNRGPQHNSEGSSKNNLEASKRSSLPKEYWMSPSRALLEMELRRNEEASKDLTKDINDSNTLMKHKEELLEKLHKKLEVLKEEKTSLQQEISDNNLLGKQVFETVEAKCQSHSERDKIKAYIDDLEKIVRLLLNLSGQLARAENAVQSLGPQVDAKLKKLTIDKRERLFAKHEEAKFLKEDIDKRSDQLSGVLRERLSDREFSCYTHFIKMKSKLTIDLQELDDKITLGEEQILELRKSIPDQSSSS